MSLQWSLAPVFILSAVLFALARRPGAPEPLAASICGVIFFAMGVAGLSSAASWGAALGTGLLYLMVGVPLSAVAITLWRSPSRAWDDASSATPSAV